MKLYMVATLSLLIFLMSIVVLNTDPAFAKKDDSKSKKKIELCCAWGNALDDGVLTFSIKNGGSGLAKIVKMAINDWEKALGGVVKFKYLKMTMRTPILKLNLKREKEKK